MTIQQHASFDSSAAELNATSKLVKAWESKNAKNAAKAGGISLMALSLAACGGSSTTAVVEETTPVITQAELDAANAAAAAAAEAQAAAEAALAAATAPVVATPAALTLSTSQDIITSAEMSSSNDTISATQLTIGASDVIVDASAADSDTLTVTTDGSAINLGSVVGIESTVVNAGGFTAGQITATNLASGTLTVNNTQAAGSTDVDVTGTGNITVAAGTGVTGTVTVAMSADAATVVSTGTATVAVIDATATTAAQLAAQTITMVSAGNVDLTATDANNLALSGTGKVTLNGASADLAGTTGSIVVSGGEVTLTAADADNIDGTTITGAVVTIDTTTDADSAFDARGVAGTLSLADGAVTADVITVASGGTVSFAGADDTTTVDVNDGAVTDSATGVANVNFAKASPGATGITVEGTNDVIKTLNVSSDVALADLTITAVTAVDVNISGTGAVTVDSSGFSTKAGSTLSAAGSSGVLTVTADAQLLTITGGSGDDAITNLTNVATVLDGGDGTDTLTTAALNNKSTISNFEVLALGVATNDFDASQLAGKSYAVTGATDIEINAASSVDVATIDLSGLSFANAAVDVKVDLTAIDATVILSNQGFTYTGSDAVDTVIGSANADVISGGEGADILDGGAGADSFDLTETTAAEDTVKVGATTTDSVTITGFSVGGTATDDDLELDLSDIEGLTAVTNLVSGDGADEAAGAHILLKVTAAATDIGAAANSILTLDGDYASAALLADALEVSGDLELTFGAFGTAGDSILVAYDDGADTKIAALTTSAVIADGAKAAADTLTVTDYVTLVGVTDATTLLAADLDNLIA